MFVLLIICWTCSLQGQSAAIADPEAPRISVRISTDKTRFVSGEDVPLQVEIWNVGKQDVFVYKGIEVEISNDLAKIDLTVYRGIHAFTPTLVIAADCFCSERSEYPPLVNELPKYWTAVPPQHFYGGNVVMRAAFFDALKVPGKYRIQGRYRSQGFLVESLNNPLTHYAQELKQLPFSAWAGEVETNTIWVQII